MGRTQESYVTTVQPSGKVTLPIAVRRRLGLEKGGPVEIRVDQGEVRIRTVAEAMRALRAEAGPLLHDAHDSVERFLADRRRDAEDERQ